MDPATSRDAKLETFTGITAGLTAAGVLLIALAPLAIPILALTALFLAPLALLPIAVLPFALLAVIAIRLRRSLRGPRHDEPIGGFAKQREPDKKPRIARHPVTQ